MKFLKVMLWLYLTFCLKESYGHVFNRESLKNTESMCSGREVNAGSLQTFHCPVDAWVFRLGGIFQDFKVFCIEQLHLPTECNFLNRLKSSDSGKRKEGRHPSSSSLQPSSITMASEHCAQSWMCFWAQVTPLLGSSSAGNWESQVHTKLWYLQLGNLLPPEPPVFTSKSDAFSKHFMGECCVLGTVGSNRDIREPNSISLNPRFWHVREKWFQVTPFHTRWLKVRPWCFVWFWLWQLLIT